MSSSFGFFSISSINFCLQRWCCIFTDATDGKLIRSTRLRSYSKVAKFDGGFGGVFGEVVLVRCS